jgi:hypothetical protein
VTEPDVVNYPALLEDVDDDKAFVAELKQLAEEAAALVDRVDHLAPSPKTRGATPFSEISPAILRAHGSAIE